jgi:Rrf2 family nitric oxide-sensitive transcriptional repressor
MRLTLYTDYALRTLMYLGLKEPKQASIAEIARAYGISESHLTKVAYHLGRTGLVKTSRGRGGGLRLAQPAGRIILGEVVRQTEEDLALAECFGDGTCVITGVCQLRTILREALTAFLGVLDRYTLADLIVPGKGRKMAKLLNLIPLSSPAAAIRARRLH